MDQRTKNRDIAAVVPPVKQQDIDKNGGIVIEKEQLEEKASIGEEEEEESGGGGGELQAATRKKQRGKYRQYEDSQVILEKIRVYRTQRYPDSEIMKLLDNIPRRTYYNHVKKLQEQNRQIMEQWMSENVEQVSEELMIYRETSCQKLREVQGIIDNKNTAPKDKMQAIEQYLAISEKLVEFDKSGRLDAMRYVKYSTPSPY